MGNNIAHETNAVAHETTTGAIVTRHLISDENFEKLRKVQQSIFIATDVSPTVRKLVNYLIQKSNLEQLKEEMIKNFNG